MILWACYFNICYRKCNELTAFILYTNSIVTNCINITWTS
jgi:hypothetical protein